MAEQRQAHLGGFRGATSNMALDQYAGNAPLPFLTNRFGGSEGEGGGSGGGWSDL
jgi:hypothetical protein